MSANLTYIFLTPLTSKAAESEAAVGVTSPDTVTTTTYNIRDDAKGAMLFTVATVCVYGLSIVAFIAGHLKRRHHINKDEERQIEQYLHRKLTNAPCDTNKFHVLRYKSNLLAGSVMGQRHNRRASLRLPHTFKPGLCPLGSPGEEEEEEGSDCGTDSQELNPLRWNSPSRGERNNRCLLSSDEGCHDSETTSPESKNLKWRELGPIGRHHRAESQKTERSVGSIRSPSTEDEVFVKEGEVCDKRFAQQRRLCSRESDRHQKMCETRPSINAEGPQYDSERTSKSQDCGRDQGDNGALSVTAERENILAAGLTLHQDDVPTTGDELQANQRVHVSTVGEPRVRFTVNHVPESREAFDAARVTSGPRPGRARRSALVPGHVKRV